MKRAVLFLCLLLSNHVVLATSVSPSSQVVVNTVQYDHVVWNGIPISFVAPVGQERILKFPSPVTLTNDNQALTTDKVAIQNNSGFLYITAKKAFTAIRIPFVIKKTGEVVLVDLSADNNTTATPVEVVLPSGQSDQADVNQGKPPQFINYVTLMRYAVQHLYSPERLVETNHRIARAPMYTTKSVNLFNNAAVMAMPLISWRGGNLYVTAVLLKNSWDNQVNLDPRSLNGQWLAATFYPTNFVTAKGSEHDRTTLFLISDRPFNNALNQMRGY